MFCSDDKAPAACGDKSQAVGTIREVSKPGPEHKEMAAVSKSDRHEIVSTETMREADPDSAQGKRLIHPCVTVRLLPQWVNTFPFVPQDVV
jgi:hypothetical protein